MGSLKDSRAAIELLRVSSERVAGVEPALLSRPWTLWRRWRRLRWCRWCRSKTLPEWSVYVRAIDWILPGLYSDPLPARPEKEASKESEGRQGLRRPAAGGNGPAGRPCTGGLPSYTAGPSVSHLFVPEYQRVLLLRLWPPEAGWEGVSGGSLRYLRPPDVRA